MSEKGIVFNIQKFSIHDGPGIRTTVFMKGCPLRCKWCANPESQSMKVQVLYDRTNCIGCGTCVNVCPESAISMDGNRHVHIDFGRCTGCVECVKCCPGRCLSCEGEYMSVEEVTQVCMQDFDFYEESGGGVTISGGEGLAQPDFVEKLIDTLREKGVHTAIETTGFVDESVFRRLAPKFDLLLFDLKHHDSQRHFEGTGVKNERIIANLRWACENGLNILPRIPVIPGFNSELTDAKAMAQLLKSAGLGRVQLLPFHQMGERKYEFLNMDYELTGVKALHPEELNDYRQVFISSGIECFF